MLNLIAEDIIVKFPIYLNRRVFVMTGYILELLQKKKNAFKHNSSADWTGINLFLHKNICCGYSLEAPQKGTSNKYP